jgi:uncharacterized protein
MASEGADGGGGTSGVTRVGLIADTHLHAEGRPAPEWVLEALDGVELILHAGDILAARVLAELEEIAIAVRGNCDRLELPFHRVLDLASGAVGLCHLSPEMPDPSDDFGRPLRVAVHGHTHQAETTWREGVLIVCPGSPVQPRGGPKSVAVLTLGAMADVLYCGEGGALWRL